MESSGVPSSHISSDENSTSSKSSELLLKLSDVLLKGVIIIISEVPECPQELIQELIQEESIQEETEQVLTKG